LWTPRHGDRAPWLQQRSDCAPSSFFCRVPQANRLLFKSITMRDVSTSLDMTMDTLANHLVNADKDMENRAGKSLALLHAAHAFRLRLRRTTELEVCFTLPRPAHLLSFRPKWRNLLLLTMSDTQQRLQSVLDSAAKQMIIVENAKGNCRRRGH